MHVIAGTWISTYIRSIVAIASFYGFAGIRRCFGTADIHGYPRFLTGLHMDSRTRKNIHGCYWICEGEGGGGPLKFFVSIAPVYVLAIVCFKIGNTRKSKFATWPLQRTVTCFWFANETQSGHDILVFPFWKGEEKNNPSIFLSGCIVWQQDKGTS